MHCHLTFEEDDDSSLHNNIIHARTEHHSPVEHPMAHHLTSADDEEEEDEEEHFPTAPLNDDVWMEEPVPDRHLCIHEHSQNDLYPYPCPYSLDQLHLIWDYAPQYMDLSNIFDFPDVIKTTSDEDILMWKMFLNFNTDSCLHSKSCYSWKWKMNTDRNCAVEDTLLNTNTLWNIY